MSRLISRLGVAAAILLASGCTWVQLSTDAEDVELVKQTDISDCKKIGTTTSTVKSKFGFINRNEEKVGKELLNLARNEAFNMGGNTVVAASAITEGSQRFTVYQCP